MASATWDMTGQVALVTGGAGSIGGAICRQLATAGAKVVIGYRSQAEKAAKMVEEMPGEGHIQAEVHVDNSDGLALLSEFITQRYGRLDILVNAAGITRFVAHDNLDLLDDQLIDDIFRVNWRGAFACVRAFRTLLEAEGQGLVVNISSIAAVTGMGSNVAYCASKAAMNAMTISLARALAPKIRVVSLSPGLTESEFVKGLDPEWREDQEQRTPLKRLAQPEDVADAFMAIANTLTFSTGCIVPVDGGRPLT